MLHHDEQLYPCQTGMYRECKFGTCKFFTLYLVLLEHESEITCSLKSYKYRSLDFRLISHQLECDHIASSSRDTKVWHCLQSANHDKANSSHLNSTFRLRLCNALNSRLRLSRLMFHWLCTDTTKQRLYAPQWLCIRPQTGSGCTGRDTNNSHGKLSSKSFWGIKLSNWTQ